MTHTHKPMPEELPRAVFDQVWDRWVEASNTNPDSRTWEFYREDMAWVYERVIEPMQQELVELREEVRRLKDGTDGLTLPAIVRLEKVE